MELVVPYSASGSVEVVENYFLNHIQGTSRLLVIAKIEKIHPIQAASWENQWCSVQFPESIPIGVVYRLVDEMCEQRFPNWREQINRILVVIFIADAIAARRVCLRVDRQ
jgi:hypothetical protein